MTGWRLVWADSELASAAWDGPDLVLRFSAACVWAPGRPARAGHLAGLTLRLTAASIDPPQAALPAGRLRDGVLEGPGGPWRAWPAPWQQDGPLRLQLTDPHGETLTLTAQCLLGPDDPSALPFHESLAC